MSIAVVSVLVVVALMLLVSSKRNDDDMIYTERFVSQSSVQPKRRTLSANNKKCPLSETPADQVTELYRYIRALPPKNQDQLYDAWSVRRDRDTSVFVKDQRPMEGPQPLPEQEMVVVK